MDRYKVDKELKRWIRHVLVRGFHEFRFVKDEDGGWECEINVTGTTFEKIKDRARCEKYAYENDIDSLVVTAREAESQSFMTYTLAFLHQKAFVIIDSENYMSQYDWLYSLGEDNDNNKIDE